MRELPGGFKGCGMVGENYALTHRYRLLAQAPETFPGGSRRIVSMRDFPVSSTMTGALFVAKPGFHGARGGAPKSKANGAWKHGLYSERAKAKRLLVKAAFEGHLKPSEAAL
jgi:hypothetical protein